MDEEEEEGSAMPIFPVKCVQLLSGTFCIIVTNKYFLYLCTDFLGNVSHCTNITWWNY